MNNFFSLFIKKKTMRNWSFQLFFNSYYFFLYIQNKNYTRNRKHVHFIYVYIYIWLYVNSFYRVV